MATVVLFSATAYVLTAYTLRVTSQSVEDEVRASLREIQVLWKARAENLARASELLSTMSDVRGAFMTRDAATIRETAADLWSRAYSEQGIFQVFDPLGREIASLSGENDQILKPGRVLPELLHRFPSQVSGFLFENGRLYYVVFTPVYVDSASGRALLNVLAAGFEINAAMLQRLRSQAGDSNFVFSAGGRIIASTLPSEPVESPGSKSTRFKRLWVGRDEYAALSTPLPDPFGEPVGALSVMRSLAASNRTFRDLKQSITLILAGAFAVALMLSYALVRRIILPIEQLDRGAAEIARRNYGYRIDANREDEFGRLARTFNSMCDSIQASREELIAQERINTIGRLSSSIIHDLRNPLAAIYGGAEILADNENLPPQQSRRLAVSIYRASRHIQEMLKELADSVRGKGEPIESCRLTEILEAVRDLLAPQAETQGTTIAVEVPPHFELPLERSRMERVFLNLVSNSLEAVRHGGTIHISAREEGGSYVVEIDDTGVGLSEEVRRSLFLPFFSHGKKSGLGLGLALSRQTVLDHGGELWAARKSGPGARFCVKLPISRERALARPASMVS